MAHLTRAGRRKLDELAAKPTEELTLTELFELNHLREVAAAEKVRRLVAEVVVLDAYDDARRFVGHDYGNGQRQHELGRRRRELGEAQHRARVDVNEYPDEDSGTAEVYGVTPADLTETARRLLGPRLRRIETAETYRRNTPSSLRTVTALRRTLKHFNVDA